MDSTSVLVLNGWMDDFMQNAYGSAWNIVKMFVNFTLDAIFYIETCGGMVWQEHTEHAPTSDLCTGRFLCSE